MPPIPDRLARLLAYHENAAASIRATIALLQQQPDGRASNGHSPTLHAALSLDEERRNKKRAWQQTYVERKKAGLVKTKKKTQPSDRSRRILLQRQHTAKTLGHFDTTTAKLPGELPFKPQGLPILITRGYLKKDPKGGGYLRTAKPFHVDPRKAATT